MRIPQGHCWRTVAKHRLKLSEASLVHHEVAGKRVPQIMHANHLELGLPTQSPVNLPNRTGRERQAAVCVEDEILRSLKARLITLFCQNRKDLVVDPEPPVSATFSTLANPA